jgi:phosphoribosylanthranilate isomerase
LERLVNSVPSTVLTVGVVVNSTKEHVDRLLELVDRIQFHGDESPSFCKRYGSRGIKAFRIRELNDLDQLGHYEQSVGGFLLDSFRQGQAGGTGHVFDWDYLLGRKFALPTLLAGGLNPGNVRDALHLDAVEGVDVSSGLESEPGVKDELLMKQFFEQLKGKGDEHAEVG